MQNRTLKIWGLVLFITLGIGAGIVAFIKLKPIKIIAESMKKLKKDAKILFVGDSMTETVDKSSGVSVPINWTYSALIKSNLAAKGKTVDVLAEGGKQTSWMLQNLPVQLAKKKYDRVYIWGGVNDIYSGVAGSRAVANIQSMVDMVIAQGGEAYVILGYNTSKFMTSDNMKPSASLPNGVSQATKDNYIAYQNLLKKTIKNATIVPLFELDPSMNTDGIHPNTSAHIVIVNQLLKNINYEN